MNSLPDVISDDEILARFILFSKWIRSDNTVKPDAFIPHPHIDLSVTRHIGLKENELWEIGKDVTILRQAKLYGRTDIQSLKIRKNGLDIIPVPLPNNKNHANITGWVKDKSQQKIIALQIAAQSIFTSKPVNIS